MRALRSVAASAGCLLLALTAGCSGVVGDAPGLPDAGPAGPSNPGPLLVRRLTNAEYDHAVRDVLGQSERVSADFPADPKVVGFDNNAESLTISALHAERYRDAAERIAAAVIASPARRAAVVGCALTGDGRDACLRAFIDAFGRRAFRRPVTPTEAAGLRELAAIAADDPDPDMAAALVIEAVLQSPSFLFRTEFGDVDAAHPGLHRLRGADLAARLSFFLWGTTPDDALLARAQAGTLDTAEGLAAAARAMLADPRARDGLGGFYRQWLRLYTLDDAHRDPALYPAWNAGLRASMESETARVVDDLIWRDGANFLDLFTARATFVDARLAALYGVAAPAGDAWGRVEMPESSARAGLLTHASYLTLTAHTEGSTLIHRGKFVREVLLCETLPSPPANVPSIPAAVPGETELERLERHRSDPACNNCHRRMDPIGMGMRRYDALGALHLVDAQMRPIPQAGNLYGYAPADFDGPVALGQRLRAAPEVAQCVVRQVFRYAFGRPEVLGPSDDGPSIDRASERFRASGYSFRELLVAVVSSDAFRYGREGGL
ncbi:MAG: uncharacterized protein JWM10_2902 [Myxococcaceae bacterium]|nr:uncharacterized protein [Myxococcaceae bacterium]